MDQKQYEELVRLVTDQVVRALAQGGGCPAEEGREKVLAAGDPALVPPELAEGRVVCPWRTTRLTGISCGTAGWSSRT